MYSEHTTFVILDSKVAIRCTLKNLDGSSISSGYFNNCFINTVNLTCSHFVFLLLYRSGTIVFLNESMFFKQITVKYFVSWFVCFALIGLCE